MNTALPRWLLTVAAALLLCTAVMHTYAIAQTRAAVAASNLAPFFGQSFQALWLMESVTLLTMAVVFGLVAARPAMASGALVAVLAVVPAGTAGLLYHFLGGRFVPAHLFLLAAALALVAGLRRAAAQRGVAAVEYAGTPVGPGGRRRAPATARPENSQQDVGR